MPVHSVLPRQAEGARIQLALDDAGHLLEVNPLVGRIQGVEQHALLHRCQWIEALDVAHGGQTCVQELSVCQD